MELKLNEKTYVSGEIKARSFRKAIEINEKIDFTQLKVKDFDELVDYVVGVYSNQFTRDEFYDGMKADDLIQTLANSISGIVGDTTEKLESKNE